MPNKILVPLVIVLVVATGILFYVVKGPWLSGPAGNVSRIPLFPTSKDIPVVKSPTASKPEPAVCAQDAKPCPDGSFVARVAPKCEFAACTSPESVIHYADITGFSFGEPLVIKVGDSVVWTNKDDTPHTVTGEGGLGSSAFTKGQTYTFTFNNLGSFNYYCTIHPEMHGSVVVSAQ